LIRSGICACYIIHAVLKSSFRFYKNPDKAEINILHSGTVIEGPGEYKSSRLLKRDRRTTLVDEILADQQLKSYSKRKYNELQQKSKGKLKLSFKSGLKKINRRPVDKDRLKKLRFVMWPFTR